MFVDITYSIDIEKGEATFFAKTRGADEFLGGPKDIVPNEKAKAYIEQLKKEGFNVAPLS
jgi:hypothetical protein